MGAAGIVASYGGPSLGQFMNLMLPETGASNGERVKEGLPQPVALLIDSIRVAAHGPHDQSGDLAPMTDPSLRSTIEALWRRNSGCRPFTPRAARCSLAA